MLDSAVVNERLAGRSRRCIRRRSGFDAGGARALLAKTH
jgi:N-acetylmuramic acid 6-phosphate (MurNAc-6-P) etherase